ncbi:MAG: Type 1 glutamine amidotransferase-like domain-containing protein [Methanomassiliicoccales archaeon]|nr:Type 1 glutamine amidotransferase-like domain-containing protein [Methanomassiliicoccales archaeon]
MLRLYLLGGEDIKDRGSKEVNGHAFSDAGGSPLVVVFPWTSREKVREDAYRRLMVDYFKELGARGVRFVEPSLPYPDMVKLVEQSDLIYLPGGDPKVLIERMRNTGASHLLANYEKVIVGNSAGAVALCAEYVLLSGDSDTFSISSGLGLVDLGVAVHYDPYMDAQLESLSTSRNIFAIPEGGAVVVSRCSISLIGPVAVFQEGRKV